MSVPFSPRVALASLSGRSNAEWARKGAEYAGAAFLGGIAIDDATRRAARAMVERDRVEFLPPDPTAFVDDQLSALQGVSIQPGVNVRTVEHDPLAEVARVCATHDAILELNAHCRQDEICQVGAGESLLADTERLCRQVRTARREGAVVSVKVRAEVSDVELPSLARDLESAGGALIHVDAMDSESVVTDVADATSMTVIANNGVRGPETVREYLEYGADAVSVGRPSDDPEVLSRVQRATAEFFEGREQATASKHSQCQATETGTKHSERHHTESQLQR